MEVGTKQLRANIEVARQAFIFGMGDGQPVVNPERLAEIGECTRDTIQKHLPDWIKQREDLLTNSGMPGNGGLLLRLSEETLASLRFDTDFARQRVDELKAESKTARKVISLLESVLTEFSKGASTLETAELLSLVSTFTSVHATKKSIDSNFLAMHKHWTKLAGVDSLMTVAETREKALATGRAKLTVTKEASDAGLNGGEPPKPAIGGVFGMRRGPVVDMVAESPGSPDPDFG